MQTITDKDRLVKLILDIFVVPDPASFVENLSVADYASKLIEKAVTYVIEDNGNDAGLISFYANDSHTKTAYIALIGVMSDYKGMGLAQKLMDQCIKDCRNTGMEKIKLEVKKENQRAITFYEHYDFYKLQEASAKSIYMKKDL